MVNGKHSLPFVLAAWSFALCVCSSVKVSAQNTARDLPGVYVPGVTFPVSITINPPGGTVVVGLEDQPPLGWVVRNISHSGVFDTQNKKVKWGPFFGGSVPPAVTYDVRPSGSGPDEQCFSGTASFGVLNQPIGGELCIPHSVPTLSGVALGGLAFALFAAGAIILNRRKMPAFSPNR